MTQGGQKSRYNPSLEILFDSPIQARPDLLWREVEGETVLLDPKRGYYYGIEGSGVKIWQLIQGKITFSDLLERLREQLEVDEETLRRDLHNFLSQLKQAGLLDRER